jgi:hypothetical protein
MNKLWSAGGPASNEDLLARALRMGTQQNAKLVVDGIYKHIRQLVAQGKEFEP